MSSVSVSQVESVVRKPVRFALTSDLHRGFSKKTFRIHQDFLAHLAKESFDVLVLAGDLGHARIKHFRGLLRDVRAAIPDRPIVAVRGNHDLWDKSRRLYFLGGAYRDLRLIHKYQDSLFALHQIHHLETGPFVLRDVLVAGWDGWYGHPSPPTNDENFMPNWVSDSSVEAPRHFHTWLAARAREKFADVLDVLEAHPDKKRVAVTHMPCFAHPRVDPEHGGDPQMMTFLRGRCDVVCCGHQHILLDEKVAGIQVYQAGSDYDRPRYMLFDV